MVDFVQVHDLVARRGWLVGLRDALDSDDLSVEIGGHKIIGPMLDGVKQVVGELLATDLANNQRLLEELGLAIGDGDDAQLPVLKATAAAKAGPGGRHVTHVAFDESWRR